MAEQQHGKSPHAGQSGVEVVRALSQAEADMAAALAAFKRARRLRLFELFRSPNIDPNAEGPEDEHVHQGVSALLNAQRHVTLAAEHVHALPTAHPARRQLGPPVRDLDTKVKQTIDALHARQEPSRLVAHLKRARRAIPIRMARDLTKG